MEIVYKRLEELKPYENNPRFNDEAVEYVANSIKEFGFKVPIVVDKNGIIVAGHTRYKASMELGLKEVPCIVADDLTDEQVKAFRLADNKVSEKAEWDIDLLVEELSDISISMEDFGFDEGTIDIDTIMDPYNIPEEEKGSLNEQYIVPPFSVLDTRQGYWQDRKKHWLEITGNLSETRDGEFGTISDSGEDNMLASINGGTSNFDPVLAEIIYKWFCLPGGKIIDPFGGEQTKGVVAGELGYEYHAVEIRQDQVDLNKEKTKQYKGVKYYCGDSNNIDSIIDGNDFDLCFTSPPYYDLEVYSKEDMSALGTYEEFMEQYKNIFTQCYNKLKDNSFLVLKVGEIRDKKTGQCRCFVADNVKMMEEIGFKFYNDMVLINACGTAPLRANNCMANRKVVKVHQNVLVFYKGDLKEIANKYPKLDFSESVDEYE